MKTLTRRIAASFRVKIQMILLAAVAFLLMPACAGASNPVHEAVRNYIEANMSWPKESVRMEFITAEPDISALGKPLTFSIEPAGYADFIGDAAFIVRISTRGRQLRTETVRARIEVLRDVLVAARMIRGGAVVADQDVRVMQQWVRRSMPDALYSPDEAIGKRIVMQIRPGTVIAGSMLREAPLVRKGKLVRVIYDNGAMRITTFGMPEEDGAAGNIIRIRNVTSNKIIYARVLGDSLVAVEI